MTDGSDFARYVDARWPDLVGGLEDDGVPPDDARLAVATTLLASRRSWSRRLREENVDVALWAEVRERAGLPHLPGDMPPHGVRPFDPQDPPDAWFARAEALRGARRRRGLVRGAAATLVVAVLATGWQWWASRPPEAEVRVEANTLPVVWYAKGELHLEDVVVALPGIEEFVASGSGVVARLRSGAVVQVAADGEVTDGASGDALDDLPEAPEFIAFTQYDVVVQAVRVPGGGWAYLLDSSRRDSAQDAIRQSESGRRALVICAGERTCSDPRTITESDGSIRLG
ncbi:hypothetical protein [Nocardioides zhouii]|uniref:Uncharacterized protein n=1 Tax=Nocardioides zhouii TaxID=1168729 RepID=A0A4Q2SNA7_9ACTN|nr:hypothetical protein [Nocardioides zhouii]RYC07175.1 hypothetical protein EUA94_15890 [Nocardioides zhouii]